jgi:hypothetical protein
MKKTMTSLSVGLLLTALVLTGCSSGGATTKAGSIDAGVKAAAQAQVDKNSVLPAAPELKALSKKAPAGKFAIVITCPLDVCTRVANEFIDGTTALGWSSRSIVAEFTPESFVSSFEAAIALKPDFIYYIAVQSYDTIASQAEAAKAAGIPIIGNSLKPGLAIGGDSPIVGQADGPVNFKTIAELQADVVIADAKDLNHVTYMYDPSSPAYVYQYESFSKKIEAAGGKVSPFEINQADAGATLLGQIVSYLQRKPDTEYFAIALDDIAIGLPDAITAAGLPLPKIIGIAPNKSSIADIKAGKMFASVQWDTLGGNLRAADVLARISVGDKFDADPLEAVMVATKKNADKVPLVTFPGVRDSYLKAWLVK